MTSKRVGSNITQVKFDFHLAINGAYAARGEKMKKHWSVAQDLIREIKNFSIENIPREANQSIDFLSKLVFGGTRL